jgi:hypothetical protein
MKAAIDFESAMVEVRKVVDFETPAQFKAMAEDVLKLSTRLPIAAREIAAIDRLSLISSVALCPAFLEAVPHWSRKTLWRRYLKCIRRCK